MEETSKLLQGLQEDCRSKPQVIIVGATRTGAVSAFLRRHMNQTPGPLSMQKAWNIKGIEGKSKDMKGNEC